MKPIYSLTRTLVLLSCIASAGQAQKQSPFADHIGLTCTQILQISSTDWIKKFTAAKDATEPSTIQAISSYGKCYDARTNRLAASLGKKAYAALYEKQFRYDFYREYALKNFNPPPFTPEESDAFTKAKNHFGELLGLLPEDKMHELHRSFGEIFAGGGVPDATKFAVYRYAIFLLESAAQAPYSPAPF
jgi:hypothetical protein